MSRFARRPSSSLLLPLLMLSAAVVLSAQHPPLAPTANTTIVVPNGPLHYGSINIPAGITVRFVAPGFGSLSTPNMPAVVICDGDAIVHGSLWLADHMMNDRPAGWVTIGEGGWGARCASVLFPPGGGLHAGTYGSVLPFSLEGGSLGGTLLTYSDQFCSQWVSTSTGGKGGGTLVLLAGGRIEVHGTISADGGGGFAGGSGGSVLLRGDAGLTVMPSGSVTARGGTAPLAAAPWPPQMSFGAPGYIRLDAWGAPPLIQGTVDPAPAVIELPYLRSQSPLAIGTTWTLNVFAPDTAWVYVVASLGPGGNIPTPFGPLGVDLVTAAGIGLTVPQPSHDPVANVQWPIPNVPAAVGLGLWVQALAVPATLPPRVTNTLAVTVQ
jgi:hypothetical protein